MSVTRDVIKGLDRAKLPKTDYWLVLGVRGKDVTFIDCQIKKRDESIQGVLVLTDDARLYDYVIVATQEEVYRKGWMMKK